MKRLITSAEEVKKYSDIYSNAYQIYKESFGSISDVWAYVHKEILAGNIPELEGRMLVKDVSREYLQNCRSKSRTDRYKDIFNSRRV
jgi:hypothetical protein